MKKIDAFTTAYIECALWSSTDENEEPMDRNHGVGNITEVCMEQIIEDCADFQEANRDLLAQAFDLYSRSSEWSHAAQAGHDFWLTRNHHGAGFWDRGLGAVGDKLTEASHAFGEFYIELKSERVSK